MVSRPEPLIPFILPGHGSCHFNYFGPISSNARFHWALFGVLFGEDGDTFDRDRRFQPGSERQPLP